MSSRDRIMAKVRAGLGDTRDGAQRQASVEQRLAERSRHLIPSRAAGKSSAELVAILRQWLAAASGHVLEVADEAAVPAAVAGYLRDHNLPARARIGDDAFLAGIAWAREPALSIERGRAIATDTAGITHALAAVAESGTVVVASGAANPVTLSFLPEANIVVVRRSDVVGPLEDAFARARSAAGAGDGRMPRTLNMISGPSRSADIGGVPVLGAHGPRRLCVIVVG